MRKKSTWFILGGLLAALLLAGVVSNFASGHPDGLDSVAREGCTFDEQDQITGGQCMAQAETDNQTKDSPLAGYSVKGISNEFLSTGLSGVLGVLITFGVGAGAFWLLKKKA
ncbi:PDGLE domain-containing protein [Dactylosporangium sp. AC04546]|uniref:PDGLE domain-containing protein n=1 Tax=Dactylosporangium sp. AC04546 TaxID=2862460 RepID=UPI001EDFA3E8|nr:PDGLE domain-containing protein [Dactylosporangium sp. AC04546]WVK85731.1 PDGLE domain-containing protein [Dactylosporangium sp. AC04546]